MRHRDARGCHSRFPRAHVAVEEPVHRNRALHVLERVPGRPALRGGQLEADARLERVDDLLPVADRRRRLDRDVVAHERERSLELEQLGKRHAAGRLDVVFVVVRLMPAAHGIADVEQVMPFPDVWREEVLQLPRQRQRGFDPACDPARAQSIGIIPPTRAGWISSTLSSRS